MGQSSGVAIGGAIFGNLMRVRTEKNTHKSSLNIMQLVLNLRQRLKDEVYSLSLRDLMAELFRAIWIIMCAFGALSSQ